MTAAAVVTPPVPAPAALMAEADTLVRLDGVCKSYGTVPAVHPLDLSIGRGEFLAILGPSGCGKTTLLRMIGGFIEPSAGAIIIEGRDVTRLAPERRPTNMVFQGYGLFPHMTVAQNIGYGLRLARATPAEITERVREVMELVHMDGFGTRMVTQLSGGQQQRVALARALVMRPAVLLLDEPLAALDLKLRKSMQEELRRIHATTGGTFIFVTHDQEEAMGLATRICVMEGGRIVQDGSPEEIYSQPGSRFVSTFIGEANVMPGERRDGSVTLASGLRFAHPGADEPVVCIVRPEKMQIAPAAAGDIVPGCDLSLPATLEDAVFLGATVKYSLRLADGRLVLVDSRDMALRRQLGIGNDVRVGWKLDDQRVLADR
ncbi:MAG: ABC transporter ATP-binding protein, partial [Dongiaceae bacterium]